MHLKTEFLLAGLVAALASPVPVRSDELADKGRGIFTKNRHAVVTVQVVQKTSFSMSGMGNEANESKQDLTGTVIDPAGLTVIALSAAEPADMFQNIMAGLGNEELDFKMDVELSDVKLLLHDGSELPAEIVLRDRDLDLAFIRPKTRPATPMVAVDLSQSTQAQIFDQVVTLNRLGVAAGRAYSASVERISAVVEKPRLFYIPDSSMTATTHGSPAFTLDGKLLGVFVMRSVKTRSGGVGMFNFNPEGVTSVILPTQDILRAAEQAPEPEPDGQPQGRNADEP